MTDRPVPATHDLGGAARYACDPIDLSPHALTAFDREVDAIRQILGAKGIMSVDELRRGIEELPAQDYERLGYYQRWLRSIVANLIRNGAMTEAEWRAALAEAA
jgi:hypothetical protein